MRNVTDFEYSLPLAFVDLDEFERRLKKLAFADDKDIITDVQIVEIFRDHYSFKDIVSRDSMVH